MTRSNEDLARILDSVSPTIGVDTWLAIDPDLGLASPEELADAVAEAAERLRSLPPLDAVQVSPARTTDPETSKAAARRISADNARGKIMLAFYRAHGAGWNGLTPEGAVRMAHLQHLASPWKRVSECKAAGLIVPTGEKYKGGRGQLQEVLYITPHGRAECERLMPGETDYIRAFQPRGAE